MFFGSIAAIVGLLIGFLSSIDLLFIVSTCFIAFGSLAILPSDFTRGVSITASSAGFILLAGRILVRADGAHLLRIMFSIQHFGFLTAYVIWGLGCTAFLPWVFQGEIYVYPVRAAAGYFLVPVYYSSSNLTQSLYLCLSYVVPVSLVVAYTGKDRFEVCDLAFKWLSVFVISTGLLDVMGAQSFLALFKNVSYSLADDSSIGSTRRVIGVMPEASTFGTVSATLFSALLILRMFLLRNWIWAFCLVGTGCFAILSASSTAYAMIIMTFFAFFVQTLIRLMFDGRLEYEKSIIEMISIFAVVILFLELVLYFDPIKRVAVELLDALVFNKSSSSSYEERSRWSRVALDAFFDSYGLGVGIGTVRTSNGMINILASSGAIGATLFFGFLIKLFLLPPPNQFVYQTYSPALALLAPFTGFALAGTSSDYGILIAIILSLQGVSDGSRKRASSMALAS